MESVMTTLPKPVVDLLQTRTPTRVAVVLKKNSPIYSHTPDAIVQDTCSYLEVAPDYKLLVVQKWSHYTILVFDVFHVAYDASTAHHTVDLPVLHVDSSKRRVARIPSSEFRNYINVQVAKLHNCNGWDAKPPYYEDQTGAAPKYFDPRDSSLL